MKKVAIFIGRFQPFHNGHLDAVRQILSAEDVGNLIIMIGSAENELTPENPLTAGERFEMIFVAMDEIGVTHDRYFIVPVRDINDYPRWPGHVKKLVPHFDIVYSGSELTRSLFEEEGGTEVREIIKDKNISATDIRKMIAEGGSWKNFVPKSVAGYLEKLEINERIEAVKK